MAEQEQRIGRESSDAESSLSITVFEADGVAKRRIEYQSGKRSTSSLVTGDEPSFSLFTLIREVNKERAASGLFRIPLRTDQLADFYATSEKLQELVIRIPVIKKKKNYYHYRVLPEDVGDVKNVLQGVEVNQREGVKRSRGTAPVRTERGAIRYRNRVLYPALAEAFFEKIPTREDVYRITYDWAIRYYKNRLGRKSIRGIDAEDLAIKSVQDLIPVIDGYQQTFTSLVSFQKFVRTVFRYDFIELLRSRRAHEYEIQDERGRERYIDPGFSRAELPSTVEFQAALEYLTDKQRRAMSLWMQNLTYKDIARTLSKEEGKVISRRAVVYRIHDAKARLRQVLEKSETVKPRIKLSKDFILSRLDALTERQKIAVTMQLEGKNAKEIADVLSKREGRIIAEANVYQHIHQAKRRLITLMQQPHTLAESIGISVEDVEALIPSLPHSQKTVMELYMQGFSREEITKKLSIVEGKSLSIRTIWFRFRRAKLNLREKFTQQAQNGEKVIYRRNKKNLS